MLSQREKFKIVGLNGRPSPHHPEAWCLMNYRCDICNHTELIWNSRDGVTPFCLKCPKCGQFRETHVDWSRDIRLINHKPKNGDRIFVDMTREKYTEHKRTFIDRMWDDTAYPMKDRYHTKEIALEQLLKNFQPGSPDVVIFRG